MEQNALPHAIGREGAAIEGESVVLFPWWSITKSVLAAAALALADQERFSLDDFYRHRPYTIRQLLQHTAGLTNYGGPPYLAAVAAGDPVWPVEDLLARVNAERLIYAPGGGWAYSNVGYLFVRQLIEETVGSELDKALHQLVFGPMGIQRTRVAMTSDDMKQTFWGNPHDYDPRWVYHGLLIGSPSDAVGFLRNLFSGRFLSEPARSAMKTMYVLGGSVPGRPWTRIGYGLGLMMGEMGDAGAAFGHSGVGHDSVSSLYCFYELPGCPVVAAFGQGANEAITEAEAARLALGR